MQLWRKMVKDSVTVESISILQSLLYMGFLPQILMEEPLK